MSSTEESAMSVRELVNRKRANLVTVSPDTPLAEVARLLLRHGIGGVPVVGRDGTTTGFVAERQIVEALNSLNEDLRNVAAQRIMQPPPTCTPDDALQDVMRRMTRERLRHLVVVENGRPVDIISVGDLVKHRLEQLETEAGVLRDYVVGQRAST
jgi:CBS domain-containing protein